MKLTGALPNNPRSTSLCFSWFVLLMMREVYGTAIIVSLSWSMASVVAPQPVRTLLITTFSGMESSHSDRYRIPDFGLGNDFIFY